MVCENPEEKDVERSQEEGSCEEEHAPSGKSEGLKGGIEGIANAFGEAKDGVAEALEGMKGDVADVVDGVKGDLVEIRDDLGEVRDEIMDIADGASEAVKKVEDSCIEAAKQNKRFPKVMKVFGALLVLVGLERCLSYAVVIAIMGMAMRDEGFGFLLSQGDPQSILSVAFGLLLAVLVAVSSVVSVALGIRLLRNRRTAASRCANILMLVEVASFVVSFMIYGITSFTFVSLTYVVVLALISVYADPRLRRERVAKREAERLESKQDQEAGVLGLDKTGKGYIELDFFNLFWIFTVCCFLGLVVETVYHMTVIDFGVYEERAGLLYGPFSPIYGVGGVLITIVLNRFHKSNPVVVFLAAAFIGAFFEYLVSWWMETSFGITAWDYTGTFLNIDGRTNFKFFCMWGCLGIAWLRWILPKLLALINRIPWNWRYSVTCVCAALMFVDCGLTLASLDRWFERQADMGENASTMAIERFCDEHYDDAFMESRFETMSINPDEATRVG